MSFLFYSQGVAVLGIALIAMGEEIGSEMALRTFGHLVSSTAYCQFFVVVWSFVYFYWIRYCSPPLLSYSFVRHHIILFQCLFKKTLSEIKSK